MRQHTVRKAILEVLEKCEPFALYEEQLREQINGFIRPPAGQAEFDDAINWLSVKQHIAVLADDIDPDVKQWLITSTGKVLLRK